jgi:uncharacterized integral membrane protein
VAALLLVLLLILILFGLGFAVVKFLIWVAIILAIVWLIGFFVRRRGRALVPLVGAARCSQLGARSESAV